MLREKTQRRLFRVLFTLGCVAPTLAVGGLAIARMTPIQRSIVLACVGDSLGVSLTAANLKTPAPGVYLLEELRVADESGDRTIAQFDRLQIRRAEQGWSVEAGVVRVDPEAAAATRLHAGRSNGVSLLAKVDKLIAMNGDNQELGRWAEVAVQFLRTEEGFTLNAGAGVSDTAPECRLRISRDQRKGSIRVAFDTGATDFRGAILPEHAAPELIRGAAFQGAGEITIDGRAHRGEIRGELTFGPTAAETTNGFAEWRSATIRVAAAQWWGPVVTNFQGEAEIESGAIHGNLVWGLNQRLGCGATDRLHAVYESATDERIPFDLLSCRLRLDSAGLEIHSTAPDGVVAILGDEPLLLEPPSGPAPLTAIVQALWPFLTPELPATTEAHEVARRLPLRSAATTIR